MTTTREALTQDVTFRQAAGADFRPTAQVLDGFCRAVGPDTEIAEIPLERVRAFIDGPGPLTRYWHRKHSALRGFYRYAESHQLVEHVPRPSIIPKQPPSLLPYLFTRQEVRRLLEATRDYRTGRFHLEPHTFRSLLLLLYGAGLRIGEALHLTLADVDLPAALVTIRDTKFYKTRLVPLGPDLCGAMRQYAEQQRKAHPLQAAESPFFVDRNGRRLRGGTVRRAFAQLRRCAGVSRTDGARYQPRLHDFRQHAGSRLMPGSAWEMALPCLYGQIWSLPSRHNPTVFFRTALWPGTEETCWITSSRIATRVGDCDQGSSARSSTRLRRSSPRTGTPPRRFVRRSPYLGTSASG